MFGDKRNLTPIMWFLVALCAFEFFIRLPYMIWLADNAYVNYSVRFQYFGRYDPWDVIFSGTTITLLALLAAYTAHSLVPHKSLRREYRAQLVGFGWPIYAMIGAVGMSAIFGIYLLGLSEISQNISAKRDLDSLELGFIVYLMLKVSLFSHAVAALCYMAFLGSGQKKYIILLAFASIITVVVSVIFSQRALLFTLGFEIIYITYLYRGLNLRKLVLYATPFAVILIGIGAARALGTGNADIGEAVLIGFDKVMSSRYFFNIGKLGAVYEWQLSSGGIDFLALNFIPEIFGNEDVIFFKDVGRIVSTEVFGLASSGVTLGLVSEAVLSFGLLFGLLFCFAFFFVAFLGERSILQERKFSMVIFFALAKVPILLNTSLGSFLYQAILETVLLLMIVPALRFVQVRPPRSRRAPPAVVAGPGGLPPKKRPAAVGSV